VPRWLTQEWLDEVRERAQGQPERPGASARMQYVITEVPDGGAIRYYWVLENGRLLENRLGDLPDAELTLTQTYEDAKRIQSGDLDPQAAFMQGRIKVEGNMAKLMALMPLTNSPEYRALQEEIRGVTDY
jgi:putative sterol carrier protein